VRAGPAVVSVAVLLLFSEVAGPGTAHGQTLDDLDDAERVVEGIEAELDEATAAYEATWASIELAQEELHDLRRQELQYVRQAEEARRAVNLQVRGVYKLGPGSRIELLMASEGPQVAVERAAMVAALQTREGVRLEEAVSANLQLDQIRGLVQDREASLQVLQEELDAQAAELQDRLQAAEGRATRIRSLVARQRRIDRGPQQGIYACIFDSAYRFRDTWGAPRSGGRRHRGTDVFAPHNHPTYAITSGVIQRHSHSRLGGLGLYLRGDDGNVYYYAHLNSIEPAGAVGNRVTAGQLIARNGSTGNASPSAPHVHFELHPGGGAAINPYPWLAAACF
jgi:murein DD-endopeptidase MepM/ murein hydrolase activator NlpD